MTQDQYGPAQGTGYVVSDEVVPDNGTGESPGEQATPMTQFQKVASSPDAPAGHEDADSTRSEEIGGAPAEAEPRPGEADAPLSDFSDLAYGSLLPDASEFQQRWHQVQFRFVDDPKGSVTEAADVIAQVTAKLEAAIAERQRAIADRQRSLRATWSEGTNGDTETLRATLLMYRAFLDQLTGAR
jgi:hypothetical protein